MKGRWWGEWSGGEWGAGGAGGAGGAVCVQISAQQERPSELTCRCMHACMQLSMHDLAALQASKWPATRTVDDVIRLVHLTTCGIHIAETGGI